MRGWQIGSWMSTYLVAVRHEQEARRVTCILSAGPYQTVAAQQRNAAGVLLALRIRTSPRMFQAHKLWHLIEHTTMWKPPRSGPVQNYTTLCLRSLAPRGGTSTSFVRLQLAAAWESPKCLMSHEMIPRSLGLAVRMHRTLAGGRTLSVNSNS